MLLGIAAIICLLSATCCGHVFYHYPNQAASYQGPRSYGYRWNWQDKGPHQYANNLYYFGAAKSRAELAKELQGAQISPQVIHVSAEECDFVDFSPLQTKAVPHPHVYVLNSYPKNVGVAHHIQTTPVSGWHHASADVNYIKVPQQATRSPFETSSGVHVKGQIGGGRTKATESEASGLSTGYIRQHFLPDHSQLSHASAPLAVDKNYAIKYLPKDIDVVAGSSYLPLRRRRRSENFNDASESKESLLQTL